MCGMTRCNVTHARTYATVVCAHIHTSLNTKPNMLTRKCLNAFKEHREVYIFDTHTHTHTHTYIHTYIHTYKHTNTHNHTHTQ